MKIAIPLRNDDKKYYCNKTYLEKITPIFITGSNLDLLKICDGILIPGGYDIYSSWYGEEIECKKTNIYNDVLDFYLINYAIRHKKPLLGICRGLQAINVYFGGTLKNVYNHYNNYHYVLSQNHKTKINSFHNQAINKIGNNLIELGHSPDNVIEIIKHKYHDIYGVQFHPELLDGDYIFNYFNSKLSHSVSLRYFDDGFPM